MAEKKVCTDRFVGYKFVGRVAGLRRHWSFAFGVNGHCAAPPLVNSHSSLVIGLRREL